MAELTDYEKLRQQPSLFVEYVLGVESFDYQCEFLDNPARHRVVASGRQVGKSRMCAWLGLHQALTNAYTRVLITAPSLRQSSLMFETLYSEIEQSGLSDEEWGIERDTQTVIEFDNGSSIHCLPTGRNGNKIRGYTADMVIVDEAAFIEDAIFEDILEPMLFATQGRMVLASTPWGKSGYFYMKFEESRSGDKWGHVQVSSYDNPIIDEDDLEEFKKGKTEAQIDREVRGKFVEDSGQFFPSQAIANCVKSGEPKREGEFSYLGADIAGDGEDCTVFYGLDDQGNVFFHEEHEKMGVLEAADYIKSLDSNYGFDRIFVDRTAIGQGTVEDLANDPKISRKLEAIYFSIQKKQQIYQRLKAALEAGALHLPHDESLRNQLESIGSDKTRNGNLRLYPRSTEKSDGKDDHCFVAGTMIATPGGETPIEDLEVGEEVLTRDGPKPIVATGSRDAEVITRFGLTGTPDHPIITPSGTRRFDTVPESSIINIWATPARLWYTEGIGTTDIRNQTTDTYVSTSGERLETTNIQLPSTDRSGSTRTERYPMVISSITRMVIPSTTESTTSSAYRGLNIRKSTVPVGSYLRNYTDKLSNQQQSGIGPKRVESGINSTTKTSKTSYTSVDTNICVTGVGRPTNQPGKNAQGSAQSPVRTISSSTNTEKRESVSGVETHSSVTNTKTRRPALKAVQPTSERTVYNLKVAESPEYFANGVLVHNCDALALAVWGMPDFGGDKSRTGGATEAVFSDGPDRGAAMRNRGPRPRRPKTITRNRRGR